MKRRNADELVGLVSCVALTLLASCAIIVCGCARTDQQRALVIMTEAANATLPALSVQIESEESACLRLDLDEARACVSESRAHWAPALAAIDTLVAVDQVAIDGRPSLSGAFAAYCTLAALWPSLPAPPRELGGCQ